MRKIIILLSVVFFSLGWTGNITNAYYLSPSKKVQYINIITKKIESNASKKTNSVAYLQKIISKIDTINTKLKNNPKYIYNKKYQDIVYILENVKVNLQEDITKNIVNYLNNSNYTEFDKAVLKFQQKYLVKLIDILLDKINEEKAYKLDLEGTFYSTNPQVALMKTNLKFKNFEVNKKGFLTAVNGDFRLENLALGLDTKLYAIKDDANEKLYVKFDKLNISGFMFAQNKKEIDEKIKKIIGKYILISKNYSSNSSENPIATINKIKNILNTKPLIREVPSKYTGKDKNIILPTKAVFEIDKLLNNDSWKTADESFINNIEDQLNNIEYVYFVKSGNSFIIKTSNDKKSYISLSNNGEINKIYIDNSKLQLAYDNNTKKVEMKYKNGSETSSMKGIIDIENENIDLIYSFGKSGFIFKDKNGNITLNIKSIDNKGKDDFYLAIKYNKTNGETKLYTSFKENNEQVFEIKGNGTLKEGKSNFQANGKIHKKDYYTDTTQTITLNLGIKDTYVSSNKYNEKITLKINDGNYDYNVDINSQVEKITPKAIQIPKNYIKIEDLK